MVKHTQTIRQLLPTRFLSVFDQKVKRSSYNLLHISNNDETWQLYFT